MPDTDKVDDYRLLDDDELDEAIDAAGLDYDPDRTRRRHKIAALEAHDAEVARREREDRLRDEPRETDATHPAVLAYRNADGSRGFLAPSVDDDGNVEYPTTADLPDGALVVGRVPAP